MTWANGYIGIPFQWDGDSQQGCSCWGLVCLVQREVFGKNLPTFKDMSREMRDSGKTDTAPYFATSREIPLGDEREGDLLHMWSLHRKKKLPLHVGVVVTRGKVLHIEEGAGSCVVNYRSDKRVKWRVIGAYRVA